MKSLILSASLIVFARGKPLNEAHKHSHYFLQALLTVTNLIVSELAFGHQNVQGSSTFERGAMGCIQKAAAILERVLAIPLSDIQRNRCRGSIQLISDLSNSHQVFH